MFGVLWNDLDLGVVSETLNWKFNRTGASRARKCKCKEEQEEQESVRMSKKVEERAIKRKEQRKICYLGVRLFITADIPFVGSRNILTINCSVT